MYARGHNIMVKLGTSSVQYPFLQHLSAGQLPKSRGSFLHIHKVVDQLKQLFSHLELGEQQQQQQQQQQRDSTRHIQFSSSERYLPILPPHGHLPACEHAACSGS